MARVPQPEPVRSNFSSEPADRYEFVQDGPDLMFEEPDHAPELATQVAYDELRTNPWLGTDDEPPTAQRLTTGEQERRALAVWRARGGPRPATPIIDALGAREGCTPSHD